MGESLTSILFIAIGIFLAYTSGKHMVVTYRDHLERARKDKYSKQDPITELGEILGLDVAAMAIMCLLGIGFIVWGLISIF